MRQHAIVLVDVERDQATDGRDAVQVVGTGLIIGLFPPAAQLLGQWSVPAPDGLTTTRS